MLRQIIIMLTVVLLSGCVAGPKQLGISSQQWQTMSADQQQKMLAGYQQIKNAPKPAKTIYNGPDINVTIAGGTAMMPPFVQAYPFAKVSFNLQSGQCKSIRLSSINMNSAVNLQTCYNGLTLAVDPSRYDPTKSTGTLRITYNPIWKRGFTYSGIASSGYVRLNNAKITIKTISDVAPVEDANNSRR